MYRVDSMTCTLLRMDTGTATNTTKPAVPAPQTAATQTPCACSTRAQALLAHAAFRARTTRSSTETCVVPHLANLRSEEHTSELQSLMRISYAAFCLKKKIQLLTH